MKKKRDKAAARRMAAAKMLEKKAKTFAGKEAYVEKNIPGIEDPAAFVAAALREKGEIP